MALQPAVQGDRHTGQRITWYAGSTTQPKDLTGATLTGTIQNRASGGVVAIAGDLALADAANGVFTWAYAAADTATVGGYFVQFTATYGDGLPDSSFVMEWVVKDRQDVS
jgi:hypothetical protein